MLFGFVGFAVGGLFCVVYMYAFNKFIWRNDSRKVDIEYCWKLLNDSNAETMNVKLFRTEGDEKAFRSIIFVEGEEAVEKVSKFLEDMGGENFTTPKFRVDKK